MPQSSPKSLKLFSWNINGLRAVLNKHALQDFLEQYQPDVLCLQEIKCKPDQLTPLDLTELEQTYQIFWNPAQKLGYSGTATLVRRSATGANVPASAHHGGYDRVIAAEPRNDGREDSGDEDGRSRKVAIAEGRILILDFAKFYLVNVYTPNSKPDLSRLSLRQETWDPEFLNLLKDLEKTKPVIACGDFNAAHEDIDLARPKQNHHNAGFTDEERLGISNLLSAGFLDTFRELHPEEKRYTWWSHWGQARKNNIGWRIDYFFASNSLKPHILSADIHESVLGSDHCPISLELSL